MISFILWYMIIGIIIGAIAIVYSVLYAKKKELNINEALKIKNAVMKDVFWDSFAVCTKSINLFLVIVKLLILPFLMQFCAYQFIKEIDNFIIEKQEHEKTF